MTRNASHITKRHMGPQFGVPFVAMIALALGALSGAPTSAHAAAEALVRAKEASSRLLTGDIAEALALYDRALNDKSLPTERRANILNDRGVANWRAGRLEQALTDFNKAAELYPEYPALYNNRGNLLASMSLPGEAVRDYNRAITLAPNYAAAYNNRANAYVALGNRKQALADFAKSIELAPTAPDPFNGRGRLQLQADRPYAALREFARAERLGSSHPAMRRNRADAYREVGQLAMAINDLSVAIAATPADLTLLIARADAHRSSQGYNAALKDYTRVLEQNPDHVEALAGRGYTYALIQTFDPALEDLNRVLERQPRHARAYAYRALTYTLMGDESLSLQDIERAIKLAPGDVAVQTIYARVLEEQGRDEEAIRIHQAALALKPGRKQNLAALKRLTGAPTERLTAIAGSELEHWTVHKTPNNRFVAISDKYANLRIPLEVFSDSTPKLIDWEVRKRPFRGIGVLRFSAGRMETGKGKVEVEYGAIVDLWRKKVVSLEPFVQGTKPSTWTWAGGKLTVASADGLTSEFVLRKLKRRTSPVAARRPSGRPSQRSFGDGEWRNPWANTDRARARQRSVRRQRRRRERNRSLFDMFFR